MQTLSFKYEDIQSSVVWHPGVNGGSVFWTHAGDSVDWVSYGVWRFFVHSAMCSKAGCVRKQNSFVVKLGSTGHVTRRIMTFA